MAIDGPLISCICVTRGKPAMLERAIHCFNYQTYENKELIILYEKDDEATKHFLGKMPHSLNIKVCEVEKSSENKLGQLRNIAIQKASGMYICQWDDDDWFHQNRLEYQYKMVCKFNYPGCIMNQWLIFDSTDNKSYASPIRHWEGSILCRKDILQEKKYENKSIGEDTTTVNHLLLRNVLYPIANAPHLYIYIFHGNNTWSHEHWLPIFRASLLLPDVINNEIIKVVNQVYNPIEGSAILDKIAIKYQMKQV